MGWGTWGEGKGRTGKGCEMSGGRMEPADLGWTGGGGGEDDRRGRSLRADGMSGWVRRCLGGGGERDGKGRGRTKKKKKQKKKKKEKNGDREWKGACAWKVRVERVGGEEGGEEKGG